VNGRFTVQKYFDHILLRGMNAHWYGQARFMTMVKIASGRKRRRNDTEFQTLQGEGIGLDRHTLWQW
jgi:hypothetical protein